jgi:hypothetical protein
MKKALVFGSILMAMGAHAAPLSFWNGDHPLSANGLGLDKWKSTLAQKGSPLTLEPTSQLQMADIVLLDGSKIRSVPNKKQAVVDTKKLKTYSADNVRQEMTSYILPKGWTALAIWHGGYAATATHTDDKNIKHGTTFSITTLPNGQQGTLIQERSIQGSIAEGLLTSIEATPLQMYRQRVDKVLQRIAITNHMHNPVIVAIREETLTKQSPEQKRYLLDSLRTATVFQIEASEREQAFAIQQMKHAGYADIIQKTK